MSNSGGFSFPAIFVAAVVVMAFALLLFDPMLFLMIFTAVVVYLIWNLRNRMRDIERRLDEKQTTDGSRQ
jgi:membrane protein implicated in regulation of membrane protease activity